MLQFVIVLICCVGASLVNAAVAPVVLTTTDINAFLAAHNTMRASLGISNLVWNTTLSTSAGNYGSGCVFAHSKSNGTYGENLYSSYPLNSNHTFVANASVSKWLAEKSVADPPTWACMTSATTCGHYTQAIWRNTKSVGCAIIHCSGALTNYVVCQYYPPGNYINMQPY